MAKDVIKEFAADGVKYLELRSTPREEKSTGLTKRRYVETVLKAIQQCKDEDVDIDVRWAPICCSGEDPVLTNGDV